MGGMLFIGLCIRDSSGRALYSKAIRYWKELLLQWLIARQA